MYKVKWNALDMSINRIGLDEVDYMVVSTVELPKSCQYNKLVYETIIFAGNDTNEIHIERYSTIQEAKAGHDQAVKLAIRIAEGVDENGFLN